MVSDRPTTIYALCDPTTNEVRYIGKSTNVRKRLVSHCSDTKRKNNYCTNWVRSLKPLKPVILELEVTNQDWVEAEQFWISYFKWLGARLTNHTTGGEGAFGITHVTSEITKAKISKALMGNKNGMGNKNTVGITPWNKGNKTYVRTRKGNYPWNKGLKTGPHSEDLKLKLSQSIKMYFMNKKG